MCTVMNSLTVTVELTVVMFVFLLIAVDITEVLAWLAFAIVS
jgi:hypothetical protein